jgi:aspartyl protease family protein
MSRTLIYVFVALAIFTGFLFWAFPEVNFTEDKQMRYVSLILVGSYLLLALFQGRLNLSEAFRYAIAWIGIALVIMVGYVYRFELLEIKDRLTSGLHPSTAKSLGKDELYFAAASDGHYYVDAMVNGVKIKFMVDTGSTRVVISPRDAQRLGFKVEELSFDTQSSTANGTVWSASVTLDNVTVENHTVDGVPASVSKDDLDVSLLGMGYLNKLKSYRVEKGGLTLQY